MVRIRISRGSGRTYWLGAALGLPLDRAGSWPPPPVRHVQIPLVCSVLFLQYAAMILLRQTRCALSRRRHVAYFHASPAWWAARKVLQRFKLADVGEGITECEVIRWYVPCTRVSGGVGAQGSCLTPPLLSYRSVSPQSSIG